MGGFGFGYLFTKAWHSYFHEGRLECQALANK